MIPQQLKQPEFRFCKVRGKSKAPFEKDWPKGYSYDDPELQKHIRNGGNYGVVAGHGSITIIDFDEFDPVFIKSVEKLGETFIVRTGSGKLHYYFICQGVDNQLLEYGGKHYGEVRANNQQVVGPGSTHPNGKPYKIENDVPILKTTKRELFEALQDYLKPKVGVADIPENTDQEIKDEPGIDNPNEVMRKLRAITKWDALLDGDWQKEGYKSRSEAEMALVSALKTRGMNFQQVDFIMTEFSRIGKWGGSPIQYKKNTYGKIRERPKSVNAVIGEPQEEHLKILKNPELLEVIDSEFDKKIQGEKETRKTVFLISCGRFVRNADSFSTNLLVNDEGGMGKDYIVRNVLSIWPNGCVEHKKRVSETAFTYMHYNDPGFSWDDKILYLEDIPNRVLNADAFKIMATSEKFEKSVHTIVVKQTAIDFVINGKPCIITTIANANPKQELLRRFPTVNCDESIEQTRGIVEKHAAFKQRGVKPDYDKGIIDALQYLKTVKVKIPYAKALANLISIEHHIMRTNFPRFCDFICFSAGCFQYQREKDNDGFILANGGDYENAKMMIRKVVSNEKSLPMTRKQRNIIEILKKKESKFHTVNELLSMFQFLDKNHIYRVFDKLAENNFVQRGVVETFSKLDEFGKPYGTKKEQVGYKLVDSGEFKLPDWKAITEFCGNSGNGGKGGKGGNDGN